jgi:phosphonate transport system permease protein
MTAFRRRVPNLSNREWLTVILAGAFIWSALQVNWSNGLIHAGGWSVLVDLIEGFVTSDLSGDVVAEAFEAAWTTVAFAVAGLSVALVFASPLALLASGVLISNPRWRGITVGGARTYLSLLRSVHELVGPGCSWRQSAYRRSPRSSRWPSHTRGFSAGSMRTD